MFIISAKMLGTQSIEREIAGQGMSAEVFKSMLSVNESFEIVTWISISLLFFIGIGSIYLVGSWNTTLKDEVDNQTHKLREKELKLSSALADRDQLLKEIHNRVRTNLTMVLAILELQLKNDTQKTNEEILKDSHSLIRSLTIVYESMSQTKKSNQVDLKNYAIKLSNRIGQSLRKEQKEIELKVLAEDDIALEVDRAIPFALIINELVMNACNHAFPKNGKGQVVIEISKNESQLFLKVTDNGKGLPENFDGSPPKGIGMRIVYAFSKQLNSSLKVNSNENTSFKLTVPL